MRGGTLTHTVPDGAAGSAAGQKGERSVVGVGGGRGGGTGHTHSVGMSGNVLLVFLASRTENPETSASSSGSSYSFRLLPSPLFPLWIRLSSFPRSRRQYPSIRSIMFSATDTAATLMDRGCGQQETRHGVLGYRYGGGCCGRVSLLLGWRSRC